MADLKKRFIGSRAFYGMVLSVAVPIMIQNGFTNFVSLLDNIMVGRLGTEEMSGVAIVNQLLFVYNLCIFGALSGAGIFTAQYCGSGDMEGVRNTFRFKLLVSVGLTAAALIVFKLAGPALIGLYLTGDSSGGDVSATLNYGLEYLDVMLAGLLFFMLIQTYSSTLRECGETVIPMKAGVAAVLVNLIFNWLLIFGHLGFPRMGVRGAAIATVLSRVVEFGIVAVWTHTHTDRQPFAKGLYRKLLVPGALAGKILTKGSPLLINEIFWSTGMAFLTQCYSTRGLSTVAGFNIASTMINLCTVVLYSMGNSIGIIVGRLLGAGHTEEAYDTDRKMIAFSAFLSLIISFLMYGLSFVFPLLYNTTLEARRIAASLIVAQAVFLPMSAAKNGTYFTLRSGGRTLITFMFDGGFVWAVSVPIAWILSRFTSLPAVWIFTAVQLGDVLKLALGLILVRKRVWVRQITV